jgi:spermidine synthase
VPLLFAATLFVSASLLFMVQPMVGKLVLPLLGGSPAVWNACMVFFQALLLLGYLYADRLTRHESPRKQWLIHTGVLGLPLAAFALAIVFGTRGNPIAAVESLAPSDGSSAILSVLAILTVAIGVPFFVVSTSATLLQKWFTYTGHPSARDPYFLYAASNFGSLISLLGYPIFIEPNMTQGDQTWFWAIGFLGLVGLIVLCGRAAVNPLGVPPTPAAVGAKAGDGQNFVGPQSGGQPGGKVPTAAAPRAAARPEATLPAEEAPSWMRTAKWTMLAFVPSSLMLGVTFHMTTDIASIPLLWVGPLALYLITFIIAFGRVPPWFRVLIGNLAPVMILLLVFLMISEVKPGTGLELLLYNLTFFAAALMCHYELARDRPSPKYLTTYFLIMSFGGVLGGIFNSLVAPLVFTHAYEFPLALIFACLMVPKLNPLENDPKESKMSGTTALAADVAAGVTTAGYGYAFRWLFRLVDQNKQVARVLDVLVPVLVGVGFWQLQQLAETSEWYRKMLVNVSQTLPERVGENTVRIIVTYALPVMVCFFFVDRPLRFALCVAAILMPVKITTESERAVHTERSFFGILKIKEFTALEQLMVDRSDKEHPVLVRDAKGAPIVMHKVTVRQLVHGTTLHGTQMVDEVRHPYDDLQLLTFGNPWDNLAVAGAQTAYDLRQEPLTYYHRTGPVGAMFAELARRGKQQEPVAMVGLGTGSVSCYARRGDRLTFYEIDPAVKKLVYDTDKYFTYVTDAKRRGANLDIRMGDARLKLKQDTDRKYALLLVDAFSSDSIPVHLLTVEAVQLYLDRLTDDGILALHISNKYVRLEPVVAAIAERHNLVARVWNDDSRWESGRIEEFGKTASSWVVLARKREDLGDRLCSDVGDVVGEYGGDTTLAELIKHEYPKVKDALDVAPAPLPDPRNPAAPVAPKAPAREQKAILVEWLDNQARQANDKKAKQYADWIRLKGSEYTTLMGVLHEVTGYGFRPIRSLDGVDPWTDDYADVMRVMMIEELQRLRGFFGLPTPVKR